MKIVIFFSGKVDTDVMVISSLLHFMKEKPSVALEILEI
jgi:hypothetical protein